MTSKFLDSIGLSGLDMGLILFIAVIVIAILLILCIVTLVKLCKLKKRYERFTQGRNSKSLEKEIGDMFEQNKNILDMTDRNRRDIRQIYKTLEDTFQKFGLVKYDAYGQMGGKLSFSLAMLNEKDDGFIINSIHGSDGCYSYTKEISGGECNITLGEEEQEALQKAMFTSKK